MGRSTAGLIAHRVNALAYVALTRRDDVVVMNIPEQGGLDLLARIDTPGSGQARFLGVILKGTAKSLADEDASRELNAYFRQTGKDRGPVQYPFPVVALIFSMETDEGFCAWRSKPLLGDGNRPALEMQQSMQCKRFTKSALDEVIDLSGDWYDALFSFLAPG
jgi:hypothetical protein